MANNQKYEFGWRSPKLPLMCKIQNNILYYKSTPYKSKYLKFKHLQSNKWTKFLNSRNIWELKFFKFCLSNAGRYSKPWAMGFYVSLMVFHPWANVNSRPLYNLLKNFKMIKNVSIKILQECICNFFFLQNFSLFLPMFKI